MTKEVRELARFISELHGGQVRFNLTKAAKIAGVTRWKMPEWLKNHGVLVQSQGHVKYVTVDDLAIAVMMGKVSPV